MNIDTFKVTFIIIFTMSITACGSESTHRDPIAKVAIVATSGGDYNNPATAMAEYRTWCGSAPSAETPCLLKIMPGIYDLGTSPLQMQPYIDIEGSGENTTIVQGNISTSDFSAGLVTGANHSEIRFLTVNNVGDGENTIAFYNSSAAPKMTNITAIAAGGVNSIGVHNVSSSPIMTNVTAKAEGQQFNYGVSNFLSSPTMTNVTTTASGGSYCNGVRNVSSSPIMANMSVTASGGTSNFGVYDSSSSPVLTNVIVTASGGDSSCGIFNDYSSGLVMINNSIIKGATHTISNSYPVTTLVGDTQLVGGPTENGGTLRCVGAFDANYFGLDANCQ